MSTRRASNSRAAAVVWFLLLCPVAEATEPDLLPIRAGLNGVVPPHKSVYAMLEDHDGFLWIGTLDGLGRFDGYEMIVFRNDPDNPGTLSHNAVYVLLEDRSNRLWIGTENGLDSLDDRRSTVRRHPVPALGRDGGPVITSAFEDSRGRLWFGTDRGLILLPADSEDFEVFPGGADGSEGLAQPTVIGIDEDLEGRLWVATGSDTRLTLHRLDEATMRFERVPVVDAPEWPLAFVVDDNDRGWIHPAVSVDLDTGETERHGLPGLSRCSSARAIVESPDGDLWFGCDDGLYRLDKNGDAARPISLAPSDGAYLEHFVRALAFDRSGTLWIGTQAGVYRFDPAAQPFRHISGDPDRSDRLRSSSISALVEDTRGRLWVGTYGGGLHRFDPDLGSVRRYCADRSASHDCPGAVIWHLHLDAAGTLWIAGECLWSLDPATDRVQLRLGPDELPDEGLAYIAEGPSGTLWLAGFDRNLYRYLPAAGSLDRVDVSGEPSLEWTDPRIDGILVDGGFLWLATGSWLGRFDPSTGALERIPIASASGAPLRSQGLWAMHPDREGRFWLGTSNGLFVFDPAGRSFDAWTTHDGLPGSVVYSILEDVEGRLWLGTNQGLSVFDPEASSNSRFRTYTTADGTGNTEFNRHAALALSDGRFAFGGMDGLTVFDPMRIRDNTYVAPVRVTRVEIWSRDGKRTLEASGLDRLVLSHRDSTFGFTFAALSFTDPASNRYAYRLDGYDEEWVDAGTRRTCQYTNLPPGDYVFRVLGSNNDRFWNDIGAELPVIIQPAVWQTWWFRLLTMVALGSVIWAAIAYRLARRREVARMRLRIADDLHDDLSSDLSGIAVVTDMVQRKTNIDPGDRRDLAAVRDVALKMVDGVRDIVWYIDPEHDNLESTIIRMRQVAETLLRDVPHRFDVELADGSAALPMTVRRNLLMIFKESLHNIVRHADAGNVVMALVVQGSRLRLSVADNGKGFDDDADCGDRHGLRGMRRRADEIGARLEIVSEPNRGTEIVMTVDLTRSRDGRSVERGPRL